MSFQYRQRCSTCPHKPSKSSAIHYQDSHQQILYQLQIQNQFVESCYKNIPEYSRSQYPANTLHTGWWQYYEIKDEKGQKDIFDSGKQDIRNTTILYHHQYDSLWQHNLQQENLHLVGLWASWYNSKWSHQPSSSPPRFSHSCLPTKPSGKP